MIRDRNTTIALIIASAMIQLFIQTINGERFNVPGTLGGTLAFILIPYLLSLLIRFIIRVTTKKFSENSFFTTFMIAWVLVILSSIVTAKYESNLKKDDSIATSASDFKYSPRGCLFEITYKQKPSIKQLPIVNGKSILRGEEASVTLQDEYFKSELFVLSTDTIKSLEEDSQIYFLNQYAINNGFDHPEFKESVNELGKQVEFRAYKTLRDTKGNEMHLIVTAHLYFKGNNLLILYAGSEADKYPTQEIVRFYESIRLN